MTGKRDFKGKGGENTGAAAPLYKRPKGEVPIGL